MKLLKNTNALVTMAMLCAISLVLVALIRFPLFPAAAFLEYDPADIPIIIGTFLFGPVAGLIVTAVVSAIQAMTVSAGSGWIGGLMHFFATGSYVLVAGLVYSHRKTTGEAILAMTLGVLAMTATMVLWNLLFTPIFMGVPRQVVVGMLVPVIIPFNLLKAGINSIIAFAVFKALHPVVKKDVFGV